MKIPGIGIDYKNDSFYYSIAVYSNANNTRRRLNQACEWIIKNYYKEINIYYWDRRIRHMGNIDYYRIIINFRKYKETIDGLLKDLEEYIRKDVKFDYCITTPDDGIIYESNIESKFLADKSYIVLYYDRNNRYDYNVINYDDIKKYLIDKKLPSDIINQFDNAVFFTDKNKILYDYYNHNNIKDRVYFLAVDSEFKRIIGG